MKDRRIQRDQIAPLVIATGKVSPGTCDQVDRERAPEVTIEVATTPLIPFPATVLQPRRDK